jgi:hypothetical protein
MSSGTFGVYGFAWRYWVTPEEASALA